MPKSAISHVEECSSNSEQQHVFQLLGHGAPAPVTLQLTSQAFACTALTQGVSLLLQPPPTLLHSWDACWSCGGSGREAETDGGGDAAGESWNAGEWRVDWADLLGAEVVKAQATGEHILVVHFVDRHPRYGRDQHSWHVGAERFLAPGEGPCQSMCEAIRSTLRGPAFSNRPRRLLAIISPTAGKGRGRDTWTRVAAPVLASAGVHVRVVYTTRKGDAFDVASALVAPPSGSASTAAVASSSIGGNTSPGTPSTGGPVPSPRGHGKSSPASSQGAAAAIAAGVPHASELDGVLVVGGDGTFNEVLNGIMRIPEIGLAATLRLRFGVIPAGSTDAVACTLHGTRCPRTAAAHVALGGSQRMDALRLDTSDGTVRYASNFCGLGFFGRVIQLSEHMRWMGPVRYGAAGALAFTQHAAWSGTLEYQPLDAAESSAIAQAPPVGKGATANGGKHHIPANGRDADQAIASNGVTTSSGASHHQPLRRRRLDSMPSPVGMPGRPLWDDDNGPSSTGSAHSDAPESSMSGVGDHHDIKVMSPASLGGGLTSPRPMSAAGDSHRLLAATPPRGTDPLLGDSGGPVMPPPLARLGSGARRSLGAAVVATSPAQVGPPSPLPGWKVLTGAWHVIAGACISCRNDAAPAGIAPKAVLCDGAVDIMAVRSCSRLEYLQHLLRLSNPSLGDHLSMPFVLSVKARAFRFTPDKSSVVNSTLPMWNVDGELLKQTAGPTRVVVLPGLLQMFAFVPDDA